VNLLFQVFADSLTRQNLPYKSFYAVVLFEKPPSTLDYFGDESPVRVRLLTRARRMSDARPRDVAAPYQTDTKGQIPVSNTST
jgi:hypothetical protein